MEFDIASAILGGIFGTLGAGVTGTCLYFLLLKPKAIAGARAEANAKQLIAEEQREKLVDDWKDEISNEHDHKWRPQFEAIADAAGLGTDFSAVLASHSNESVRVWTNLHRLAHARDRLLVAQRISMVLNEPDRRTADAMDLILRCMDELQKLDVVRPDPARGAEIIQETSEQTLGQMETLADVMLHTALDVLDPERAGKKPYWQELEESLRGQITEKVSDD